MRPTREALSSAPSAGQHGRAAWRHRATRGTSERQRARTPSTSCDVRLAGDAEAVVAERRPARAGQRSSTRALRACRRPRAPPVAAAASASEWAHASASTCVRRGRGARRTRSPPRPAGEGSTSGGLSPSASSCVGRRVGRRARSRAAHDVSRSRNSLISGERIVLATRSGRARRRALSSRVDSDRARRAARRPRAVGAASRARASRVPQPRSPGAYDRELLRWRSGCAARQVAAPGGSSNERGAGARGSPALPSRAGERRHLERRRVALAGAQSGSRSLGTRGSLAGRRRPAGEWSRRRPRR